MKKVPFPSWAREANVRLMEKMRNKVCWSAMRSDSLKLVDTQKLVAHLEFCCLLASESQTPKDTQYTGG